MTEETLTIGKFKEAYLKGEVIGASQVDGCVSFLWRNGNKGRVVMANGQPKMWKSGNAAESYLRMLEVEKDMNLV